MDVKRLLEEAVGHDWVVRVEPDEQREGGSRVELQHPMSDGYVIHLPPGLDQAQTMQRVLTADQDLIAELTLLRGRPAAVDQELLASLLRLAQAFKWTSLETASVAGLFAERGLLSSEEVQWVRRWPNWT
jgi:hypothetical protein